MWWLLLLVLAGCAAPLDLPAEGEGEADEPPSLPIACATSELEFDAAMVAYAGQRGLPGAWVAFMAAQYGRLCLARDVAAWHRAHGGVQLSAAGCQPIDDAAGEERVAAIQALVDVAYPGLPVTIRWKGPGIPVRLGCSKAWGKLTGIGTVRDGGIVHELGHALGLPHHYGSGEQDGLGLNMWNAHETCTMDLTAGLDSACAAALGVDVPDGDALVDAQMAVYCGGCRRGDFEAAACDACEPEPVLAPG